MSGGYPLRETNVLRDDLHPGIKALEFRQAGMHAFRHGVNHRWELAGMNPAVLRQQMGYSTVTTTARYTGDIPIKEVRAAFSTNSSPQIVGSKNAKLLQNGGPIRDVC